MTIKRRSRIVSFRLSDEEYDSLKNVTNSRGARSVSEFTRSVACNMNTGDDGTGDIGDSLRMLNARMEALVHKIETLTEALEEKNGTDPMAIKEKEPNL
ncbi:MAG: hypothetical protein JXA73_17275 [Acidobacteria bacterium]|nr:hypothetical protein [Acidobacteriota bacterium]